jgi:ATP-dependent helicase/nuclease subunit B
VIDFQDNNDSAFSPHPVPPDALIPALEEGATVVTATRRLARAIQSEYARHRGAGSWATPEVVPWPAWLQARFRQLRDCGQLGRPRVCLDEWQSSALWERLLAADAGTRQLLMPGQASDGFREAWRLLREWRLPQPAVQARAGEDGQVFLRLARAFERELDALDCIDAAQLAELLAPALARSAGPPVLFAGFDRLNPSQQALFDALGARARRIADPRRSRTAGVAAFADARSELAAAAAWARQQLDADPTARIGIVVPDLDGQAGRLEDLLDEALCPERLWPGRADSPRPWNVSLGRPLADTAAVASALLALQLPGGPVETIQVGRLLRSPFLGGADEAERRACLEAWLRECAGDRMRPGQLLGLLRMREGPMACPDLAARLAGFLDTLQDGPRRRRPSDWAAALTRALRRLGWPGDGPTDSVTWQTTEAWAELLEAFARLDGVSGRLAYGEALNRLRRMAGERRFQPETPAVPIQVLGMLETAGLEFDALWVSGLHDGVLPVPLRPNPFLPATLQRELGMPRACPETELASARHLVDRLAAAAPEVCFSYPQVQDDEPLRPSPVIAHLPRLNGLPERRPGVAAGQLAARALETVDDSRAPAVSGTVSGGTGLLTSQSSCPFQAFAVHRLRARPLETPAAGVNPMARGSFMHRALSLLWRKLGRLAGLRALDPAGRAKTVHAAAEQAVDELPAELPGGLLAIELEEAVRRIGELLEIELTRSDFEVIGNEESVTVALGPLQLRGQVDRIDRVAGGLVIIDYKTGSASAARWDGERPAEPQLPLYALAFRDQVVGLAFASLKPGAVGFTGRARDGEAFGPVLSQRALLGEAGWEEALAAWADTLEALACAFADGDARVDPILPTRAGGSCTWCHLATLCRRDELLRAGVIGDD